jgi:two-component system phosphate regulon response regulator PhoB
MHAAAPPHLAEILVVEDEEDVREVLEHMLTRAGYLVRAAGDGIEALAALRRSPPDLVLLDRLLPRLGGLQICQQIKADPKLKGVRVIMVTALGEEADIVSGFDAGADDYVPKPFKQAELKARIRAVLRRGPAESEARDRLELGGLVVDRARHEVLVNGEAVSFTGSELRILYLLAAQEGRTLTRRQVIQEALDDQTGLVPRNVDVHVAAIRKKIGPYRGLIHTIRGVGYRLDAAPSH